MFSEDSTTKREFGTIKNRSSYFFQRKDLLFLVFWEPIRISRFCESLGKFFEYYPS